MDSGRIIVLIILLVYYCFRYIKDKKIRNIILSVICIFSIVAVTFLLNPAKNMLMYNLLVSDYIKILDIILLILVFILPSREKLEEKSSS